MSQEDDYNDYDVDEAYYDDQSEPIELDNDNRIIGKYEFLLRDEIEKEREKKSMNLKNIVH